MDAVEAGCIRVPQVGFGTWRLYGEECARGVADALEAGYRYIDTAARYENEEAVGRGLRLSGVPRGDLLVSTKLPRDVPAVKVRESVRESLSKLGTDYIDLLLMHWPNSETPQGSTIEAMLDLVDDGIVRAIGVSNFTAEVLREVSGHYPIVMNQVEYHPYLAQASLLEAAVELGQVFGAYAPLARGRVSEDPIVLRIAAEHRKTAGQVALRWLIQQPRVVVIPKTTSPARRRENLDIFDFSLSGEEMGEIGARASDGRIVNPPFAPVWDKPA
jgi:2,5-diketo-D-gluconate reductase B